MVSLRFHLVMVALALWPALAPATPPQTPGGICELVLGNSMLGNSGILVSPNGVNVVTKSPLKDLNNLDVEKNQGFVALLANIPFARDIIHEIPLFATLEWESRQESAFATIRMKDGNVISVHLDSRGLIDIRVGASNDRDRDDKLFQRVIALLRQNGAEALLFGKSYMFPKDPQDGFELWLTRLDGNNPQARAATQNILIHLSIN